MSSVLPAFFEDYLGSASIRACLDEVALLTHMLAFEAALARAQARLGIIPEGAARAIVDACDPARFDREVLVRGTADHSNPAIPLVAALTAEVATIDEAAAGYVHWGSTSQDVMDTAFVLGLRAATRGLDRTAGAIEALLAALADRHRETPMVARTLSQHAAPTTFGLKSALWLTSVATARAALVDVAAALPLQFAGAGGTLAAYGDQGIALRDALAVELDLPAAPPWQSDRSRLRSFAAAAASLAAAAGKIGHDLVLMAQTEVAEVREAADARGGSSALPHKRNPVAAMAVAAGARVTPGQLATVLASFDFEHERAAGAWHAELAGLAALAITTGGVLEQLHRALDGLEVDAAAMTRNLALTEGRVLSEAVVMRLAPALGRAAAQALVKRAERGAGAGETSAAGGTGFRAALAAIPEIRAHLDDAALDATLDPARYLGAATDFIDEILEKHGHA